jgi:hypothetical protein
MEGLVLYLPFDEGSGDTVSDLSGNGNDGMLVGNPEWVKGKYGNALKFNGEENSNYVEVPDDPTLNPATEITCSAWIYFDTFFGSGGIISKYIGSGSQRSYTIHTHHDNALALGADISSDGVYSAGVTAVSVGTEAETLKEGEWQHIAMTFKAGEFVRLYINGEMMGEEDATVVGSLFDNDVPLLVGTDFQIGGQHRAGQPREFTGIIDEVSIYNRVLSEDEIRSLLDGVISSVDYHQKLSVTWGRIKDKE